jgi:valyl-tRNA synthetase
MEMIQRYSADAVRYWAASTARVATAVISEEKIQMGAEADHQAVECGALQ